MSNKTEMYTQELHSSTFRFKSLCRSDGTNCFTGRHWAVSTQNIICKNNFLSLGVQVLAVIVRDGMFLALCEHHIANLRKLSEEKRAKWYHMLKLASGVEDGRFLWFCLQYIHWKKNKYALAEPRLPSSLIHDVVFSGTWRPRLRRKTLKGSC